MTKNKKKMAKSTIAIIVMAVVMVAMLAFGGTYAYFTAQATKVTGSVTTGTVLLQNNAVTFATDKIVPGMEILGKDQKISVKNSSDVETYIFVKLTLASDGLTLKDTAPAADGDAQLVVTLAKTGDNANFTKLDGQTGVYYIKTAAVATATDIDFATSIVFQGMSNSVDTTAGSLMGKTINVTVESKAIQAFSFTGDTAVADAFAACEFKAA